MSYKFAKLFDFKAGQLLVTKEINEDNDQYEIKSELRIDYQQTILTISLTSGYDEEQDRDTNFIAFNPVIACRIYHTLLETMGINPIERTEQP